MAARRFVPAVLALASCTLALSAPPAVPPDIAAAPSKAALPGEEGVAVRQYTTITLDAEGRVTRHEESAFKLFTPWMIGHGYFDPNLHWNDARATLTVDQARTYAADGRVIDARPEAIVSNTAGELQWAAPYAHLRTTTVAQLGVETNGTTVLAYTVADRKPSGVPPWGVIDVEGALPVLDQKIRVTVPRSVPLAAAWSSPACGGATPAVTDDGDSKRLDVARQKVPAINVNALAAGGSGPCRLLYSTASDWGAARKVIESRVLPALHADETVAAKAKELVGSSALDGERIARLHAFVVDGIQTVRWPLDALDYTARPARDVLGSSVGHALDKAVLLAALLRASGYEATVALVRGEAGEVPPLAVPALFDEAWVRATAGGETLWLDPTRAADRHHALHLAGHAVLPLDGSATAPVRLPGLDPATNRAALRLSLALEDGGHELRVTGREELDVAGLYAPALTYDKDGDGAPALLSSPLKTWGRARSSDVTVLERSPRATALRAKVEAGAIPLGRDPSKPVVLTLPRVPGALAGDAFQAWRGGPVRVALAAPADERVELTLTLPAGFELLYRPAPLVVDNAIGHFAREVAVLGRTLTIRTTLTLHASEVSGDGYKALRALLAEADGAAGRTIVLRPS